MKKIYLHYIIFFILFLFISKNYAQEQSYINKIKFIGNETLSNSELQKTIVEKKYSVFKKLIFWKKPPPFSKALLEKDTERLLRFYQTEGFLDTQIQTHYVQTKNRINIVFNIVENKPVIVERISIDYVDKFMRSEDSLKIHKKREHFPLTENKRFRDAWLSQSESKLQDLLINSGYAYAQLQPLILFSADSQSVHIRFDVQSGQLCHFGSLSVSGNIKTPTASILRQASTQNKKFSEKEIFKTQRQIYDLGVFRFVSVKTNLDSLQRQTLPVEILVKEAPRLTTKFGIGYGREDEFRIFAEVQKLGVVTPTGRLLLRVKHSALEPYNLSFRWTKPAVLHRNDNLVVNPFARKENEAAFTVDRFGGGMTYQRRLSQEFSASLSHLVEQVHLGVSQATRMETLENSGISIYNKSVSNIHFAFDSSQPAFSPNSGVYAGINLDIAGNAFQSHFSYTKLTVEGRKYQKLKGIVAAVRIKGGFINPTGNLSVTPVEERFYSGGSNSIRGWARFQLGPKNTDGIPIGGNSLFEGNVELRFPVYQNFAAVIFYDTGNVWQETMVYKLNHLHSAVGCGLRFATPVGPIRLDIGFPATEKGNPQLHLSVGQAF